MFINYDIVFSYVFGNMTSIISSIILQHIHVSDIGLLVEDMAPCRGDEA